MNWVAADLPACSLCGHSRRALFATDGLLTGREEARGSKLEGVLKKSRRRGVRTPGRAGGRAPWSC
jgi:hypothetical protein